MVDKKDKHYIRNPYQKLKKPPVEEPQDNNNQKSDDYSRDKDKDNYGFYNSCRNTVRNGSANADFYLEILKYYFYEYAPQQWLNIVNVATPEELESLADQRRITQSETNFKIEKRARESDLAKSNNEKLEYINTKSKVLKIWNDSSKAKSNLEYEKARIDINYQSTLTNEDFNEDLCQRLQCNDQNTVKRRNNEYSELNDFRRQLQMKDSEIVESVNLSNTCQSELETLSIAHQAESNRKNIIIQNLNNDIEQLNKNMRTNLNEPPPPPKTSILSRVKNHFDGSNYQSLAHQEQYTGTNYGSNNNHFPAQSSEFFEIKKTLDMLVKTQNYNNKIINKVSYLKRGSDYTYNVVNRIFSGATLTLAIYAAQIYLFLQILKFLKSIVIKTVDDLAGNISLNKKKKKKKSNHNKELFAETMKYISPLILSTISPIIKKLRAGAMSLRSKTKRLVSIVILGGSLSKIKLPNGEDYTIVHLNINPVHHYEPVDKIIMNKDPERKIAIPEIIDIEIVIDEPEINDNHPKTRIDTSGLIERGLRKSKSKRCNNFSNLISEDILFEDSDEDVTQETSKIYNQPIKIRI